ncbi:MAG: hypothetical protein P8K68_10930 [Algibacter sp.]|uniref:hypothetical protein n=1 Tax=Algibacter sp. TaxID=1872428 RepID=UPI00261098AE|nr:hypothetical protein [Algibacter sp.]MDG1728405.1 hypothetical protein [Algibacter sp.]MDG2179280.1 hypothetical protein [Algibacter sp.]
MKTNFYILLILLLTVSFGNAQSSSVVVEIESNKTISVSNEDEIISVTAEVNTIKNDSLLIDAAKVNATIARSSSDIRVYLNRKRNVSNFNLVFQENYKATRA